MDAPFWFALLGFVAAYFFAAITGAFFRPGEWYERLKKPSWRPPNRLFAPVWTILYVMIAISGWLVWREAGFVGAVWPLGVYALQLVLNAAWLREGAQMIPLIAAPPSSRRRLRAALAKVRKTTGVTAMLPEFSSCACARSESACA